MAMRLQADKIFFNSFSVMKPQKNNPMAVQLIAQFLQVATCSCHWIGQRPCTSKSQALADALPLLGIKNAQAQTRFETYQTKVKTRIKVLGSHFSPNPSHIQAARNQNFFVCKDVAKLSAPLPRPAISGTTAGWKM